MVLFKQILAILGFAILGGGFLGLWVFLIVKYLGLLVPVLVGLVIGILAYVSIRYLVSSTVVPKETTVA